MVRVNNRVKVGLYSPSKCHQIVIPSKLIANFTSSGRYSSVDENRKRNQTQLF